MQGSHSEFEMKFPDFSLISPSSVIKYHLYTKNIICTAQNVRILHELDIIHVAYLVTAFKCLIHIHRDPFGLSDEIAKL